MRRATPSHPRPRVLAVVTAAAGAALVASSSSAAAAGRAPTAQRDDPVTVQLLSITDYHAGSPAPWERAAAPIRYSDGHTVPVGGSAHLKAHLDRLRAGNPLTTTFSNGDNVTAYSYLDKGSNYEHGLDSYNQLGMEFTTVGNHDLDWNISYLQKHYSPQACPAVGVDDCFPRADGSPFSGVAGSPISANLKWKDSGATVYAPYVVKTFKRDDGATVKVGIIGATIPGADTWPMSFNERVSVTDPLPEVNARAEQLKAQGVNAVVLSLHDGVEKADNYADSCAGLGGSAYALALQASPVIDAIITGHTHLVFSCPVPDPAGNPRPVSQAGSHGRAVNRLQLSIDPRSGRVLRDATVSEVLPNTTDVTPDEGLQRTEGYWRSFMAARATSSVATATAPVGNDRDALGQSALGNLAADAQLWSGSLDPRTAATLSLVDTAGVQGWDTTTHAGLDPVDGHITHRNALEAFGRDQKLVTVSMTGAQLVAALEQQWRPTGFYPLAVSRGVHYTAVPAAPAGQRVRDLTLGGRPVDRDATYRVVLSSEELVEARHGFTALTVGRDRVSHLHLDNHTFVSYLRHLGTVAPPALDRVDVG